MDDSKQRILARRAHFLAAALTGAASASCSSAQVCLDLPAETDATSDGTPEAATDSASDAMCADGQVLSWSKPGCDAPPDSCYDPADSCAAFTIVCSCKGKSISAPCGAAPEPWESTGDCPDAK